jgi:hypothetical protein
MTIEELPCEKCQERHLRYGHNGLSDCHSALREESTPHAYLLNVMRRCNRLKPGGENYNPCQHGIVFEHWQNAHPELWTLALLSLGVDNDD